jgi:uncharacterized protein
MGKRGALISLGARGAVLGLEKSPDGKGTSLVQGLNLSVADLLGRPGESRDFTISAVITDVGNPLARLDESPVKGELKAESVVEGILITGGARGSGALKCARCLMDLSEAVDVELCELFVAPGHEQTDEDAYKVTGKEIDLEPMLHDAFVLALPLNPVCTKDCLGMCSGCGKNLNEEACVCVQDEIDPRWAELALVRERLQD